MGVSKKYFQELVDQILAIENKADLKDFLEGILTPKELEEIPNRLQIVKLLKKGLPHKEIAEKLGVGVATVTRGSREVSREKFNMV